MSATTPDRLRDLELKPVTTWQTTPSANEFDEEIVDPKLERRLKWKLDLFILPLVSGVYFFAAMDRSDLANAKIAGLSKELSLSPKDYSNAANMFLVSYIIFQLPGTLLIRKIRAPIQFGTAMLLWGLLTVVTSVIKTKNELLALRFLVGIAEAFVQGVVFYLPFWYQYNELATRGAIFYSMSTVGAAFNGMISYAITKDLAGANGWRPWRWIFLIEGVTPCAFSFVVFALLPSSPSGVRFGFTAAEKVRLVQRSIAAHNTAEARLKIKKVPVVLLSVHTWLLVVIACCGHFCISSMTNFLPAIIEGFGYSTVNAQLFTVIVYACACVGILFWARVADHTNARGLTLAASSIGAVVGYALLIGVENRNARFAATCLVAFSIYPNIVLQLSWSSMSFVGYTRRGSALAFINIFSQVFAICGNSVYVDPPYYRKGNAAALGLSTLAMIFSLILRWHFSFLNRKKQRGSSQASEFRQMTLEALGDKHPDFFYTT